MEEAVSAAEAYAAAWVRRDDLPAHPDKVPPPDTVHTAAAVTPQAGNPKQPGAKPNGHKNYPKKTEGNGRKASNGTAKDNNWENPQSEMLKMMRRLLEEMCKGKPQGHAPKAQGSQPPHKDLKAKFTKPASKNTVKRDNSQRTDFDSLQARCYRCQKIGHFRQDCRVNIGAVDECCVTEWYCEDHAPDSAEEDF